MRVRLLTNNMLNGYSLKMCQDYWQPFNYPNQHPFSGGGSKSRLKKTG